MSTIKNKNNKKINFCVYFLNLVQGIFAQKIKFACIYQFFVVSLQRKCWKSIKNSTEIYWKSHKNKC